METKWIADTADLVISGAGGFQVLRHKTPAERTSRFLPWGVAQCLVLALAAYFDLVLFLSLALWVALLIASVAYKPSGRSRIEVRFRDGGIHWEGGSVHGVSTFWQNECARADVFSGQYGFVTAEGDRRILFETDVRTLAGFNLWEQYAAACGCALISTNDPEGKSSVLPS